MALDQLRARPQSEDAWSASRPTTPAHLSLQTQLVVDYANDPLVYESSRGESDSENVALVSDQLRMHVGASLGLLDFALVFAQLPIDVLYRGDRFGAWPTATGFGGGDLAFGGRLVFFERPLGALAVELTATAPVGKQGDGVPGVAGDAGATFTPLLIAELSLPALRLTGNAGVRFRKSVRLPSLAFDDELTYALALTVPLARNVLDAHAEAFGATPSANVGFRPASPLEALLGLKLRAGKAWSFGLASGMGLLRGYGAPDLRVLALVAFRAEPFATRSFEAAEPSEEQSAEETPEPVAMTEVAPAHTPKATAATTPPADDDSDGMTNDVDQCPALAGSPDLGGCPQYFQLDAQTGLLAWNTPLGWKRRRAVLESESRPVVEELAHVLENNPKLRVVIEAHEVPSEDTERLARVTEDRARTLYEALLAGGARPRQIDAYGCAGNRPITSLHGRDARKNERTEVFVIQPLPANGMPSTVGCQSVSSPEPSPTPTPEQKPAKEPDALREFGDAGPRSRTKRILREGVKAA